MSMFCRQCEQAVDGKNCSVVGVCGKTPRVAALQDLLIHSLKAIAVYGEMCRELGIKDKDIDLFVMEGLFATVTNVDFDPDRLQEIILESFEAKKKIKSLFRQAYK